jgi:hypothetical protein
MSQLKKLLIQEIKLLKRKKSKVQAGQRISRMLVFVLEMKKYPDIASEESFVGFYDLV